MGILPEPNYDHFGKRRHAWAELAAMALMLLAVAVLLLAALIWLAAHSEAVVAGLSWFWSSVHAHVVSAPLHTQLFFGAVGLLVVAMLVVFYASQSYQLVDGEAGDGDE